MSATEFTTAAFVRSHGREPRGRGSWGFQQSVSHAAFDSDMVGEVAFFQGTYAEAKKQARQHFAAGSVVAVMP